MKKMFILLPLLCSLSQSHAMETLKKYNPYDIENVIIKNVALAALGGVSIGFTINENNNKQQFSLGLANFALANYDAPNPTDLFIRFLVYMNIYTGSLASTNLTKKQLKKLWQQFTGYVYQEKNNKNQTTAEFITKK